jgi:predicted dehydrogenase
VAGKGESTILRVGLVGAGVIGNVHRAVYDQHPATKVVALADPRGQEVLKQGGAAYVPGSAATSGAKLPVYTSLSALLAAKKVDIIDICAPTPTHRDLAIEALRAGKHVLCEKPMGRTLADCEAILPVARASKGKFMVAHCLRFWPVYEYLHGAVTSGRYGRVERARFGRHVIVPAGGWFLDGRISGGAILDLHIHDVDTASWIFGPPTAITAFGRIGPSGCYDQIEAIWHYDDDRLVLLEGMWMGTAPSAFEMSFEVSMEKATVTYNSSRKPDLQIHIPGQDMVAPEVSAQDGYFREIDHFIGAIREDRPIERATPESSCLSVALVENEIKSIESRATVGTRA